MPNNRVNADSQQGQKKEERLCNAPPIVLSVVCPFLYHESAGISMLQHPCSLRTTEYLNSMSVPLRHQSRMVRSERPKYFAASATVKRRGSEMFMHTPSRRRVFQGLAESERESSASRFVSNQYIFV
jgi:hypothetical protein